MADNLDHGQILLHVLNKFEYIGTALGALIIYYRWGNRVSKELLTL
jgi:hypothetical protein